MKTTVIVPGIAAFYLMIVYAEASRREEENEIEKPDNNVR